MTSENKKSVDPKSFSQKVRQSEMPFAMTQAFLGQSDSTGALQMV
jgi:hypothetical protein